MLPQRQFRRLDKARLPRTDLARMTPALRLAVEDLRRAHAGYGESGAVRGLHLASQALVDLLDGELEIPRKQVFLRDRPRPHRRSGGRIVYELHGECDPEGPLEIYTRTAAHGRPVALKSLLNTLLHEWVHHYDFSVFDESVHCAGFYERLNQLYRPARGWVDELTREVRTD
jgi:hypothetical protein